MRDEPTTPREPDPAFRRTLIRVMAMQLAALALLWLLQLRYHG